MFSTLSYLRSLGKGPYFRGAGVADEMLRELLQQKHSKKLELKLRFNHRPERFGPRQAHVGRSVGT